MSGEEADEEEEEEEEADDDEDEDDEDEEDEEDEKELEEDELDLSDELAFSGAKLSSTLTMPRRPRCSLAASLVTSPFGPAAWQMCGERSEKSSSMTAPRRSEPSSLSWCSMDTSCRPFCRNAMRVPGGTSAPDCATTDLLTKDS